MERRDLVQMLESFRRERTDAERQLADLQRRLDALRKAGDGIEELLASENSVAASEDASSPESATPPAATVSSPLTEVAASHQTQLKEPSGGTAALIVLKSDPNRFWTVREVWDEQVKRGWAADTKDARAAVRVALVRLERRNPAVDRLDGPTTAYRWTSHESSNGSHPQELS